MEDDEVRVYGRSEARDGGEGELVDFNIKGRYVGALARDHEFARDGVERDEGVGKQGLLSGLLTRADLESWRTHGKYREVFLAPRW